MPRNSQGLSTEFLKTLLEVGDEVYYSNEKCTFIGCLQTGGPHYEAMIAFSKTRGHNGSEAHCYDKHGKLSSQAVVLRTENTEKCYYVSLEELTVSFPTMKRLAGQYVRFLVGGPNNNKVDFPAGTVGQIVDKDTFKVLTKRLGLTEYYDLTAFESVSQKNYEIISKEEYDEAVKIFNETSKKPKETKTSDSFHIDIEVGDWLHFYTDSYRKQYGGHYGRIKKIERKFDVSGDNNYVFQLDVIYNLDTSSMKSVNSQCTISEKVWLQKSIRKTEGNAKRYLESRYTSRITPKEQQRFFEGDWVKNPRNSHFGYNIIGRIGKSTFERTSTGIKYHHLEFDLYYNLETQQIISPKNFPINGQANNNFEKDMVVVPSPPQSAFDEYERKVRGGSGSQPVRMEEIILEEVSPGVGISEQIEKMHAKNYIDAKKITEKFDAAGNWFFGTGEISKPISVQFYEQEPILINRKKKTKNKLIIL